MENFQNLYKEIAETITEKIEGVRWVDLWHNQVSFLEEEHPFPTPSIFLNFRSINTQDLGEKQQEVDLQVDFYLFYETFSDTFRGSFNQQTALEFLGLMDEIHGNFHGTSGENYSSMRRVGFSSVDTGSAGNLYVVNFTCKIQDTSAMKYYEDGEVKAFEIGNFDDEEFTIPG